MSSHFQYATCRVVARAGGWSHRGLGSWLLFSRDGSLNRLPVWLELQCFIKIEKYAQALKNIHTYLVTAALDMPAFGFLIHFSTGSPTAISPSVNIQKSSYLFMGTKLSSSWFFVIRPTKKAEFLIVFMHWFDCMGLILAWGRRLTEAH